MSDQDSSNLDDSEDLLSSKRRNFWRLWKRRALWASFLLLLLVPLYGTLSLCSIHFFASLAALTYPVFFRPIERWSSRFLSGSRIAEDRRFAPFCRPFFFSVFVSDLSSALGGVRRQEGQDRYDMVLGLGEEQGRTALLESVSCE